MHNNIHSKMYPSWQPLKNDARIGSSETRCCDDLLVCPDLSIALYFRDEISSGEKHSQLFSARTWNLVSNNIVIILLHFKHFSKYFYCYVGFPAQNFSNFFCMLCYVVWFLYYRKFLRKLTKLDFLYEFCMYVMKLRTETEL